MLKANDLTSPTVVSWDVVNFWARIRIPLKKAGHPGQQRTLALLSRSFYWPNMEDDFEQFVKTCLLCQQDRVERQKTAGLLKPLPIPDKLWTGQFLYRLHHWISKGEGFWVDYGGGRPLFQVCFFFPRPTCMYCRGGRGSILQECCKVLGNTGGCGEWSGCSVHRTFLFELMGTKLNFSTTNHPQTDGQTERVNGLNEEYLRHLIAANQHNKLGWSFGYCQILL